MLKEIICTALWLALIPVLTLQKAGGEMAGKVVSETKADSITPSSDSGKLSPLSQAPAPFGRYTENINGVSLELVRVPTGTFLMGNDRSPNPEEKPAHQVNLRSFFIGQYEITRQQWNIVVDTLPKSSRDLKRQYVGPVFGGTIEETMPAEALFWDDAVEFCDRLTRFTGKKYRLPSEAEWEYACRAGTQTEYSFGNNVNYDLAYFRNVATNDPSFWLWPVGGKGYTNAWGLYDMHGNVAEWCLDIKHSNYTAAPNDGSAWTQGGDQGQRSQRGGQYGLRSELGRSSARSFWPRAFTVSGNGFRVVVEATPVILNGAVTATSAASYTTNSLASESIVALFGSGLANVAQTASGLPLPATLAGASVNLKDSSGNEYLAPLFFASAEQINFQIPPGLALGPAVVSVVTNGRIGAPYATEITRINPGLFTADASGTGLAAAVALRVKANGEQVYEPVGRFDATTNRFIALPIDVSNPGEQVFLLLFGTGFRNRSTLSNVTAKIGEVDAEVMFAGTQSGFVGLDQCNLRLPNSLAGRGDVNVSIIVDGQPGNRVQLRIK